MTPNWVKSEWVEFETLLAYAKDPAGKRQRAIPLLVEKWDIPEDIAIFTHVNFTRPDRETIAWRQLFTALGVTLEPEAPKTPSAPNWFLKHPYGMPPNFTGRVDERAMLSQWLREDPHPLLVLRALGGFGKSALAWHWISHDLDPVEWPRLVWWGFYDERGFEVFLSETLDYLRRSGGTHLTGASHPQSPSQQVSALLNALRQPGTLLILDGFERALRAYGGMGAAYQGDEGSDQLSGRDAISPHAENFLRGLAALPNLQGKVLLTSRLRPRILETRFGEMLGGCCERELTQMQPRDAVAFFRAQGIRGARAEIERVCEPYGYHPLSLRLLAGMIASDLQRPGDIAIAGDLDVSGDLVQRKTHVLETAYNSLPPEERKLLSRLACFRGAVEYEAIKAIAGEEDNLDHQLQHLLSRGLLHRTDSQSPSHPVPQLPSFDLHPIVRRYAYERLGSEARAAAHTKLRDYFAAVDTPSRVTHIEELNPVIELYHHTIRAGRYDEASRILHSRLVPNPLYFQFGAYQLMIELKRALFPDGEDKPPRLKGESTRAWMLNVLANSYSLSGQPRSATPLYEIQNNLQDNLDNKKNLAIGLGNLATQQMIIGALREAEANLRRYIKLSRELEIIEENADAFRELGRTLAYYGRWDESGQELDTARTMFETRNNVQGQGINWAYRALRSLLMLRDQSQNSLITDHCQLATESARRALELAEEDARTDYPVERDFVRAHWVLGAAQRAAGDLPQADRHLSEALTRCRGINLVEMEADILLDLARLSFDYGLQQAQSSAQDEAASKHFKEALRRVEEAVTITERSGYALQGADVHLLLAELALAGYTLERGNVGMLSVEGEKQRGDQEIALWHARQARELTACDGPPDHTYKVAYEEAGRMIADLEG
jgi:tetratricopeptide (TPR) repeat protein